MRRKIILLLYSMESLTATRLKELLGVSYGTLYYHLDFLKPFINQVGRGKYSLNEEGREVAERLRSELRIRQECVKPTSLTFFERVAASPTRYAPLAAASAGLYIFLSNITPVKPVLLFLVFSGEKTLFSPILSIVITLAYLTLVGKFLGKGGGGFGGLSVICLMSYASISIFLSSIFMLDLVGIWYEGLIPLLKYLFIAAHIAQLMVLSAGLTYSRGVSWEKGLVAALFLSYLSLLASSLNAF